MEKKANKKTLICIVICLVFHLVFWPFVFKTVFGKMDSYIIELVDIYIPGGASDEFNRELSIDIYDYWIFHLNNKEQDEIKKDIEMNNWRIMNDTDVMIVCDYTNFDVDNNDIYKSINNHKCYIYIFDCDNEIELPNNKGYFLGNDCSHWLIFIYDTVSNYYYVIHQSM